MSDTNGLSMGYGMAKTMTINHKQEKQLVKEAEMEFKRRGKFKRVFPSIDYHYYKQFFTEERMLNYVLDQKLMSKRRLATVPIPAPLSLPSSQPSNAISMKQKIEYLNNKSHMINMAN